MAIEGSVDARYHFPLSLSFRASEHSRPAVVLEVFDHNNVRFPRILRSAAANGKRVPRKRARMKVRIKKKDPLLVDGKRPRPMYVDYKDIELLSKLVNRHGRIVSRRKSGCSAASQHAVSQAVKRARFMALMPYVGD